MARTGESYATARREVIKRYKVYRHGASTFGMNSFAAMMPDTSKLAQAVLRSGMMPDTSKLAQAVLRSGMMPDTSKLAAAMVPDTSKLAAAMVPDTSNLAQAVLRHWRT